MRRRLSSASTTVLLLAMLASGCRGGGVTGNPSGEEDTRARAERLSRETLVIDTHIDVPYRLGERWEDISVRTERGHFDYPRAREGGLDAAFMSVFVPASFQETGGAKEKADELIDLVERFEFDWPDSFAVARSADEVLSLFGTGKIALLIGMENGAPIEDDLANLGHFHDRGIRYITLTHAEDNLICDSSYSEERTWNGLSPFGRRVVAEMNRLGILVDVSHVTDEAFYQVLEVSRAPVIASHSSCRHFTPGWERNMSDEMIRALGDNGGVVHVNFGSAFILEEARAQSSAFWKARREFIESEGLDPDHERVKQFQEQYWEEHERVYGDVGDVVDHIDRIVELAGVDHVGFGSDFDGVGALPEGLKDVSGYPNLIAGLLQRGYSEEDVRKFCSGNLLRVWAEVDRVAGELQASE